MNDSKDLGATCYAQARIRAVEMSIADRRMHLAVITKDGAHADRLMAVVLDIRALEATLGTLREFTS